MISKTMHGILQLKAEALLILSNQEIERRIVQCSADVHHGYEITN
jgi:hypothetical protein